jgi:hypothetical protein
VGPVAAIAVDALMFGEQLVLRPRDQMYPTGEFVQAADRLAAPVPPQRDTPPHEGQQALHDRILSVLVEQERLLLQRRRLPDDLQLSFEAAPGLAWGDDDHCGKRTGRPDERFPCVLSRQKMHDISRFGGDFLDVIDNGEIDVARNGPAELANERVGSHECAFDEMRPRPTREISKIKDERRISALQTEQKLGLLLGQSQRADPVSEGGPLEERTSYELKDDDGKDDCNTDWYESKRRMVDEREQWADTRRQSAVDEQRHDRLPASTLLRRHELVERSLSIGGQRWVRDANGSGERLECCERVSIG